MRLTFQLRFHTHPGQSLLLTGNHEFFGDGEPAKALPLHYLNSEVWQLIIVFPARTAPNSDITYNYILREADGCMLEDWE